MWGTNSAEPETTEKMKEEVSPGSAQGSKDTCLSSPLSSLPESNDGEEGPHIQIVNDGSFQQNRAICTWPTNVPVIRGKIGEGRERNAE